MIILGAGLSGCLAGIMNPDAKILEAKDRDSFLQSPEHKAVLRFRSDKISRITGIPFRQVQVRKSIWCNGTEYRLPDIRFTNMYSKKVIGGYYDRSIVNLETVTRWVAPEDFHQQVLRQCGHRVQYGSKVSMIDKEQVALVDFTSIRRDGGPIISTLAMPLIAKILNIESPVNFSAGRRVHVTRFRVKNCDLNVSMYYPDDQYPVYRASLMRDLLSIELIREPKDPNEARMCYLEVLASLGIDGSDVSIVDEGSQIGKLDYRLDDRTRKSWILKLTMDYNIFSLGRFAVWKNILQDDVYDDAMRIRGWINSGSHYDMMKDVSG